MTRSTRLLLVLAAAVTPLFSTATSHAATMYAVGLDSVNSPVYTIDTVTGTQTLLGNSGVANLNSLAMSPSGVLYAAGGSPGSNVLVTINQATGTATNVASINTGSFQSNIRALAFDAAGTLYASNRPSSGAGSGAARLVTIDPTTGAGTVLNTFGPADMQGLDVSPTGTLYGISPTAPNAGLYQIRTNPVVLPAIPIGAMGANSIESIAFEQNGTLWGIETGATGGSLYTIDTTTGARTLVFNSGLSGNLRGIEIALAPVPLPAALWLFGTGLAAVAGFTRRPQHHHVTK